MPQWRVSYYRLPGQARGPAPTTDYRTLPLPPEYEVRDGTDPIDEGQRCPQPLAAVDLVRRAVADVRQGRYQQRNLNDPQEYNASLLPGREVAPLLPLLLPHFSHIECL